MRKNVQFVCFPQLWTYLFLKKCIFSSIFDLLLLTKLCKISSNIFSSIYIILVRANLSKPLSKLHLFCQKFSDFSFFFVFVCLPGFYAHYSIFWKISWKLPQNVKMVNANKITKWGNKCCFIQICIATRLGCI